MSRGAVSLPHEHGAYLTLAGGAIAAMALSPRPLVALGAALAMAAAFFARGPVERRAFGAGAARWDPVALVGLLGIVGLAGAYLVVEAGARAAPPLAAAIALVGVSYLARRQREHRSSGFELAAMVALGAGAGLMLLAGGADLRTAAVCGVALGAHAGCAVPLVRSELRAVERSRATAADRTALALLVCGAGVLVALGARWALLALAPRLVQLGLRQVTPRTPLRPALVGVRETVLLAAAVALVIAVLR